MVMKPETRYYVLLGKVLAAVKKSLTLRDAAIDLEGNAEDEYVIVRLTIHGKQLFYNLATADAEKITEQEALDTLMGLYSVTD